MGKDPAFLFYPGDASNDTQFMNRLERGAYFDLVKSQRLFRGFTTAQLRHVLGKDFETVWPALEVILEHENEKYYIHWVRESIDKREDFEGRQSERAKKRWLYRGNAVAMPQKEDENEIEKVIEERGGDLKGREKKTVVAGEDFLKNLRSSPAYSHINLDAEFGKMDIWLSLPSNRHRRKTPRFILAWLNKIEAPIKTSIIPINSVSRSSILDRPDPTPEQREKNRLAAKVAVEQIAKG